MAKRSGGRTSRSERRAGKERAQRAREHGLPGRQEPPLRVRAATPEPGSVEGEDRSSDAPAAPRGKSGGVPPWVWVAGVAAALLAGAYVLSLYRDQAPSEARPEAEPAAAPSASALESTEPEPVPSDALPAQPVPAVAPAESAPPVASPPTTAPQKPQVQKPVASPARAPVVVAPSAPAVPTVPAPTPAPAVPPAAQPTSPKPADNPY